MYIDDYIDMMTEDDDVDDDDGGGGGRDCWRRQ